MKQEEKSNNVRLAATQALLNSVEFIKPSFEAEVPVLSVGWEPLCQTVDAQDERNAIMQVICEATQIKSDKRVCVAALQCLVNIMSLYYRFMEPYMTKALFPVSALKEVQRKAFSQLVFFQITYDAMQSQEDEICLQGIEFWSNVCDEEIELAVEAEDVWWLVCTSLFALPAEQLRLGGRAGQAARARQQVLRQGRAAVHIARAAQVPHSPGGCWLIGAGCLGERSLQDDADDEDEWTPAKAAGVCIMLMSQCIGEDVLAQSLSFITGNIVSADWRFRDAAVMAFGAWRAGGAGGGCEWRARRFRLGAGRRRVGQAAAAGAGGAAHHGRPAARRPHHGARQRRLVPRSPLRGLPRGGARAAHPAAAPARPLRRPAAAAARRHQRLLGQLLQFWTSFLTCKLTRCKGFWHSDKWFLVSKL